jgi:site-specific recombinase XerD
MNTKYIILPKIYRPSLPEGQWFVYFSVLDEYSGKLKRFRISDGFGKCNNQAEKENNARKLISKYTDRLKSGWTPFVDKKVIYSQNKEQVKQKHPGRPSKKPVDIYMEKFLNDTKERKSHATWQKYKSELKAFQNWMKTNKLDQIDISYFDNQYAKEFIEFLSSNKLSGKTKNQYIITLNALWKEAAKTRYLLKNPWPSIEKFKETTIPQKPLAKPIIEILKNHLPGNDQQLWLAAQFMYYCYIRLRELRFLKIKDIDFFEGKIRLSADITKTDKTRIVDVNLQFINDLFGKYKLNDYSGEYYVFTTSKEPGLKPVGKNYFWNHFDKIRKQLKIPRDYKFYAFKHTGAVVALRNGANIKDIQHQMGHSSVSITDEYLKSMVGYESEFFKNKMPLL